MTINDYLLNTKYNCKINENGRRIFDIIYKYSVIPHSSKLGIKEVPELIFIDSIGFISEYIDFDNKTYIILGSDIITSFAKYNYIYYNNKSDDEVKNLFFKSISRKLLSLNEINYSLFFAEKYAENKWDINKSIKDDNLNLLLKTFIIQTSLIIHHEYTHFLIQKKLWQTEKFENDIKNLVSNFFLDEYLVEEFEYLYERVLIYSNFFESTFEKISSKNIKNFLIKAKNYYLNSKCLIQETICDVNSIIMTEHLLNFIDKDKNKKGNFEKMILTINNIRLSSYINHYSRKIGKNNVNDYDFIIQSIFRYFYIRSFFKNEFNFQFEDIEKKYDKKILNRFLPFLLLDIEKNQKDIKYWTKEWFNTTEQIISLLK